MQLLWTEEAADNLSASRITCLRTRQHAADLVFAIHNAPSVLLTFPYRGRQGKKQGTRELVLSSLPYVVVYQVSGDVIDVARILHGAQNGP